MTYTGPNLNLKALERELLNAVTDAPDLNALKQIHVAALDRKDRVSELMSRLKSITPKKHKSFGQTVNNIKSRVSKALEARKSVLEIKTLSSRLANKHADVTLPV